MQFLTRNRDKVDNIGSFGRVSVNCTEKALFKLMFDFDYLIIELSAALKKMKRQNPRHVSFITSTLMVR